MKYLCFIVAYFFCIQSYAQTSGDCLGAIPLCDELYVETNSPSGEGDVPGEINSAITGSGHVCCFTEDNSIWYTFTANNDGDLGFSIIPNNLDDDYDWALFNLTDADCDDLFNDIELLVSCNAAGDIGCHGETGATGASEWSIQGAGCNFFPPSVNFGFSALNALVPVQKGNTYVLYLSNWTGSTSGYTLDFSSSVDVGVFDDQEPEFLDVYIPDCPSDIFEVFFNEPIDCNSIEESAIFLSGPNGTIPITIEASACGNSLTTNFIEFVLDETIESGSYALVFENGESLYFLDNCGNALMSDTFLVNYDFPPLNLGPDTSICKGDTYILQSNISDVSYLWSDNSTEQSLEVTEAGIYSVIIDDGCVTRSDTVEVAVEDSGDPSIFELPSGFTPNNDVLNPVYRIVAEDVEFIEYQLKVWNRWGEKVFETKVHTEGWDGRYKNEPAPTGVYICYMEATLINCLGETTHKTKKREFLLLR